MIYYFIVSFSLGIVFEKYFNLGLAFALFVALVSAAVFFILRKEEFEGHLLGPGHFEDALLKPKTILIIGLAFCLGVMRTSLVDTAPDKNLYARVGQKVSFGAVVADEPDARDAATHYTVQPQNSKSLVLLTADRYPELNYGDQIKVSGKLELPKNFTNDNGSEFDYISYLSKDKINFTMYRPQIQKIGSEGGNKIFSFLYGIKNLFIQKISDVVPEPNSSLLAGVIFGVKQSLGQNLLDDFRKVGLIHIVVLSGYNITIISVGVFYALSFLNMRNLSFALAAVFIFLFSVMVGLGATVIRACIMALVAILAKFLGRPADALRWLFIAALFMLLWNPLTLFYDPSFQLSFMATLGLILFSSYIENFIARTRLSKFIPAKFKTREIVSSTLAVQLFVLPLLIKMSGFVSLISFLVNPIVLPLVPWAMTFGGLTGALGLLPFVGQILSWPFGAVSFLLTQIIISITEFASRIPYATLNLGNFSLFAVFIWYAAYGFLYYKLRQQNSFSRSLEISFGN